MRKIRSQFILPIAFCIFIIACKENTTINNKLWLSSYEEKAQIGDSISVNIFAEKTEITNITIKKTINGIAQPNYKKSLNTKSMTFPYQFKEEIIPGDETGVVVYSFYGNYNNNIVDAADLVLTINLAQEPLLLKYDWTLTSQIVQGEEFATADMTDDINRFNSDLTWEVDWGDIKSTGQMETLNSYCSWKPLFKGAVMDSIYMIKYNVFSPAVPIITKYKVLKLEDKQMILESLQDLSAFGYAKDEKVTEVFSAISKNSEFTPYRGANADNYIIESCKPGTY